MPDTGFRHTRPIRAELRSAAAGNRADHAHGLRGAFSGIGRFTLRPQPARDDGGAEAATGANGASGAVSGGGRGASGGGDPDGHPFRHARGRGDSGGPCFDIHVPPNGYAWWYLDAISDCGEKALSIIGFIGSVFSPWYRWSGRRNPADHCCLNVVTYGRGGRWTMTDRGEAALRLSADTLRIGPSSMHWDGMRLIVDIDEATLPHPGRLQGCVTLTPAAFTSVELPLTPDGAHVWRPFAPVAEVSVDLNQPGWRWQGHGYLDANFGTAALEDDFSYWTWGRYPTPDGATCFYDATRRDGSTLVFGAAFDRQGRATPIDLPPKTPVARSLWAVRRETRADPGYQPRQVKAMLDAPFYTRSVVRTRLDGVESDGVHEALDLNRFRSPLLKPLLAVKVPRRRHWRWDD
jgi:carotenoid 1,2-hydratase